MDPTKLAKGKPCLIRVPGWCNNEPETTVPCHYRLIGYSGMGLKMEDLFFAFGCSDCHAIVDRRRIVSTISRSQCQLYLLEGVLRTQAYFLERGILMFADSLSEAEVSQ